MMNSICQINDLLNHCTTIINKDKINRAGLLEGMAGSALYNFYYSKFLNKESNYDKGLQLLQKSFTLISANKRSLDDTSYTSGLSGIAWLVHHLVKVKILEEDNILFLENIENEIVKRIEQNIKINNYDPLYGFIGESRLLVDNIRYYRFEEAICNIVYSIERSSVNKNKYTWTKQLKDKDNNCLIEVYDLGIAHGTSGILLLLMSIYEIGILPDLCFQLIESHLNWLLEYESPVGIIPRYPSSLFVERKNEIESNSNSRLAWCYGDLCIAYIFLKAGKIFNKTAWKSKGVEIATVNMHRPFRQTGVTNDKKMGIIDGCLCHGTSGISLMYKKFYDLTQNEEFEYYSQQWYNLTVRLLERYLSKGKYTVPYYNEEKIFCGLLNGITGMGLLIMSRPNNDIQKWDNVLFL